MSDHDTGSRGWVDRVRHWLWLDRTQRTDNRNANRGFYPGGPPAYVNRKPVGRRFALVMLAIGFGIALVILAVRDAEGSTAADRQGPTPAFTIVIEPVGAIR